MNNLIKKVYIGSIAFCVIGAVLIDCRIAVTGTVVLTLGALGIMVGPLACSCMEGTP